MSTAAAPRLFDPDQDLAEVLAAPVIRAVDDSSLRTRPGALPAEIDDVCLFDYMEYFILWE